MTPAPKQRWKFNDGKQRWLVEIVFARTGNVSVKILEASPGSSRVVGKEYSSGGLEDIFSGRSNNNWTYLEGQEAP